MTPRCRRSLNSGAISPDETLILGVRGKLHAFSDLPLEVEDFETAAEFYNLCRAKGVQDSNTDFLLCAIVHRHDIELFSTDKDFEQFNKHIDFKLHVLSP